MARELQYYGDLDQTGLTVIARVYNALGAQVGADVSCTEAGSLAIYIGNMPSAALGQYGVRFFSGSVLLGQGIIYWNGTEEIFPSDFDPAVDVVARVTLVDTTTTNTDMRGTDSALLASSYVAPNNAGITANGVAIAAIPTNPLLTNDARLDTLDATISSRLAAADYVAPDNGAIANMQIITDELHKIHGLSAGKPMTVTPTSREVDDIVQTITGDGQTTTTVTRA